ncbi:RNA polymerase sigma-70 factor, ECF subfamily [Nitrosomonas ureae]|uniref:RNA polymerase sigma-70 factor, ECF subfamily n=1 Tax=Nitrosomonas ureae TaxID=44577 RepID=A0A285BU28_9PROT|nr:sigma-70 family RNA polymerase sigma factor [Nitrosomonas ureae]SNX58807.1 RNA polymerase sigma-70 factor, ECF subfamily [Nitrosomonas ureae]
MMMPVENWTQELSTLFIINRVQLRRAAYKILGDWDLSDDIVQDAYIKVTEVSAMQNVKQPLAYLFQVVRNLAIDRYRRGIFETELFKSEEEGLFVQALTGMPETNAINRQHLTLMAQALAKLPERTKRVFMLYRLDGYTHRMIADELNISTSLANILIHEATEHCKGILLK